MHRHFDKEDALAHVLKKRAEGVVTVSEPHGTEMPGYLSAGADACKETAIVLLLVWLFLYLLKIPMATSFIVFVAFGAGWVAWKAGRSGWLGWARLERLHRMIEQEKFEIEHHRPQEREELVALYSAKGFEGKLLGDVVDVIMADQDRLLKVMLEEEMGLTLEAYEHPLQQAMGAAVGSACAVAVCALLFWLLPVYGVGIGAFLLVAGASVLAAHYESNRLISAVVWNVSLAALAFGIAYFVAKVFL